MSSPVAQVSVLGAVLLIALLAAPLSADDLSRDPTRPPQSAQKIQAVQPTALPSGHWQVVSILVSPQRRVATVNGRTVQEGDLVDGARVVRIEAAAVHLRAGARQLKVQLAPEQIKRPATHAGKETGEP